jgi:hypothetical protein
MKYSKRIEKELFAEDLTVVCQVSVAGTKLIFDTGAAGQAAGRI